MVCEWIGAGAIGKVHEVHAWTNRPVWPQGSEIDKPTDKVDLSKSPDLKTAMESANISSLPGLEKLNEPPLPSPSAELTRCPCSSNSWRVSN